MNFSQKVLRLYQKMLHHFGPQHWWPADSPLEIMIGAVLTQNTNWKNVERAIDNLKNADLVNLEKLLKLHPAELAELIRPAGYFTVKTKRLQNLLRFIWQNYDGDIHLFFNQSTDTLREELLSVSGIGPETADSIALYAAGKTTFVVDAYTWRIGLRHYLFSQEDDYQTMKQFFEDHLPADAQMFNEYHALLVAVGKNFCKPRNPLCNRCPLNDEEHDPNLPENLSL